MFLTKGQTSMLSSILQLILVIFIFIVVLALAYLSAKLTGKVQGNLTKNANIKTIETHRVTNNKFIQIIKVADKYIVIGVSKDSMEFFTEIDGDQLELPEAQIPIKENFQQILSKIKNGKTDK